jgi:hypothetical protein
MLFTLFLFVFCLVVFFFVVKRMYRGQNDRLPVLSNRVNSHKNEIFIFSHANAHFPDTEIQPVISLQGEVPEIVVYENSRVAARYKIEPKANGMSLNGAYLHSSVRVNANSSVQIDGFISRDKEKYNRETDEGVRFQPFMLSDRGEANAMLKGAGTFARGLHYPGIVSGGTTRLVCICDQCKESFSLDFIHAGFSEIQYFYSENSKEVLFVKYGEIPNLPVQLQEHVDELVLQEVENNLPQSSDGKFRFYNTLRCPHCRAPYIDFEHNRHLRKTEYYAHYYLNTTPLYFS